MTDCQRGSTLFACQNLINMHLCGLIRFQWNAGIDADVRRAVKDRAARFIHWQAIKSRRHGLHDLYLLFCDCILNLVCLIGDLTRDLL